MFKMLFKIGNTYFFKFIINFSLLLLFFIIVYLFYNYNYLTAFFFILASYSISFTISYYYIDELILSKHNVIRFIQKFVIHCIIILLIIMLINFIIFIFSLIIYVKLNVNYELLSNIMDEIIILLGNMSDVVNDTIKGGVSVKSTLDVLSDPAGILDSINIFKLLKINGILAQIAVTSMLGTVIILLSLTTIISAFYGVKIIDYFELDRRFPSLSKYIRFRNNLKAYYNNI